jgi:hypothetical protein
MKGSSDELDEVLIVFAVAATIKSGIESVRSVISLSLQGIDQLK